MHFERHASTRMTDPIVRVRCMMENNLEAVDTTKEPKESAGTVNFSTLILFLKTANAMFVLS